MIKGRIAGGHNQAEGQALDQAEGKQQVHRGGGEELHPGAQEVQYAPDHAHLPHAETLEE